jgi:hypothetical protein
VADPSTTPVAPFNPAATQVPREGSGCFKPLVIGCGVVLVLLVAGMVAVMLSAPALLRWSLHYAEASLASRLPADTTAAERQRLHQAFEAAGRTKVTDQPGLTRLQAAQRLIIRLSSTSGPLTHPQVRELTESLEAVAGRAPPAPSPVAAGDGG